MGPFFGRSMASRRPRSWSQSQPRHPRLFLERLETRACPSNLLFSTYLGGNGFDQPGGDGSGHPIVLDSSGNAYVSGGTGSTNFPVTPGAFQTTHNGADQDGFVAKFSSTGALLWATYLGGSGRDDCTGIAVDASGDVFVTGWAQGDFPTTPGTVEPVRPPGTGYVYDETAFVAELNPSGSALIYSTFVGGTGFGGVGRAVKVDSAGNAYVAISTTVAGNETTAGALQPTYPGGSFETYIAKLTPGGQALAYATYLGGTTFDVPQDMALDPSGDVFLVGDTSSTDFPTTPGAFQTTDHGGANPGDGMPNGDAFVCKLNATGTGLIYSTYLGGSGFEEGVGIAADGAGNAYVVGYTYSPDFPTVNPFQAALNGPFDAFVTKLNATGTGLDYSTYLGGSGGEYGYGVAVDASGDAYIAGITGSADFPTVDPIQAKNAGGYDAFVSQLTPDGNSLGFSTYLGGSSNDYGLALAVDAAGDVYLVGSTSSTDFPTTPGAFQTMNAGGDDDGFLAKIAIGEPLTVTSVGAVSPDPRNTPVSAVDVTFSEPIDPSTFDDQALTLTDDGGANLITNAVSISLVSGSTYQLGGLAGLTTAEGDYTLSVNAADIQDQNGFAGTGSLSTSWLMDTTPPAGIVSPLRKTGTSLGFPVTVTGTDPNGANGSPPSGIASFTIDVSINGGAWQKWTTVAPGSTSGGSASATATYTGQSNTTYAFYATATDAAGNTQAYRPSIEASTYLGDLTPPITWVNPTTGANPSSLNASTGTFTLNLSGRAPGGEPLTYFEVYVGIDLGGGGNTRQIGAAIPAGFPDARGVYHATITYQGLTDGISHSYQFSSLGVDGAGLVQTAPVNPVSFNNRSFTAGSLQMTALTVENGAAERSYVRYIGVDFNESDAQSGGQLTAIAGSLKTSSPEIQLFKYDLNGDVSSKTAVSLSAVSASVIDHAIDLDFGAAGLGGNANTTAGDGYYELDVTVGTATFEHHFYRLLGDVTGDGLVNNNDLTAIASELALSAPTGYTPLSADVNGDGTVTAFDLTLATRAKGHKLASGLPLG
jgi:hypothetical protein